MITEHETLLVTRIKQDILTSLLKGKGGGAWEIGPDKVRVTISFFDYEYRDHEGGYYKVYQDYIVVPGGILVKKDWSCVFKQFDDSGEVLPLLISDLTQIGLLAEKLAFSEQLGQLVPVCQSCGTIIGHAEKLLALQEAVACFLNKEIGFSSLEKALKASR